MLNIVLSVINVDRFPKYSVIYAQAPSPESWAHKSSVQSCRRGHISSGGWRVNRREGRTKCEREEGRKANMGRNREKLQGAVGKEGGFPPPFFWHMWHSYVGQWDAVMLLSGRGCGCLLHARQCGPKGVFGKGPEALALLCG